MSLSHAPVVGNGVGEALTGVRAGWAIEPRNRRVRGADVVETCGRQYLRRRHARVVGGPRAVREPVHVRKSPCARTGKVR